MEDVSVGGSGVFGGDSLDEEGLLEWVQRSEDGKKGWMG